MNTNNKLSLNGEFSRKEHGATEYAKNIQLSDDYKTAENEDGFEEIFKLVYSSATSYKALGKLIIDEAIILFANVVNGGVKYFCITEYNDYNKSQRIILKTTKIIVSDYNHVSADYTFNTKKDRIITWGDGLLDDSNRPFTVNIDTLDYINSYTGELIADTNTISTFVNVKPLIYEVEIIDGGKLKGGAYFITTRVYYSDDVISPWDTVRGPYYINGETGLTYNKSFKLKVSDISYKAKAIELAVILKSEGVVISKIKDKYIVDSNNNGNIDLAIINNEGSDIDLTELLVKSSNFSKIGILAKVNNKQYIGGIEEEDSFINYQKYANKIHTSYKILSDREMKEDDTCFQDGESQAFDIALILNSGSLTPPFHISGRTSHNDDERINSNNPESKYFYNTNPDYSKSKIPASDELLVNDFRLNEELPFVNKVLVEFHNTDTDNNIGSVLYENVVNFKALVTNNGNITNVTGFNINVSPGKLGITKISANPSIADNVNYKIIIRANTILGSTYDDITDKFNIHNKALRIDGGFTKDFTSNVNVFPLNVKRIGQMSYHENKDELYPSDDTVVYPKGNVRHHRFPTIRELGVIEDAAYEYDKVRMKPVFDNIIIPDDIKHLVKGVVITYIRKDVNDRTIFVSTLKPTMIHGEMPPSQTLTYTKFTNSYVGGDAYLKLINQDLLNSKSDDLITHIMPLCYEELLYEMTPPINELFVSTYNANKTFNNSLGFTSNPTNAGIGKSRHVSTYTHSIKLADNTAPINTQYNALIVSKHEYIEHNQISSKKDKLSDITFNNVASDRFILIKAKARHAVNTSNNLRNGLAFSDMILPNPRNITVNPYTILSGLRHPWEVKGTHTYLYFPYVEFTLQVLVPYVYAYSQKRNIHFGFNNNHTRVIAEVKEIEGSVITIDNLKGDITKGLVNLSETMFPYRPINKSQYYEFIIKQGIEPFAAPHTTNAKDDFMTILSDFNEGKGSKLSWSVETIRYSGYINANYYYTKDDKDKIIAKEDPNNKVPSMNPLANHAPYYDKDNHSLNVYGSPLVDASYKRKVKDAFNAVVWSDTANDVKTNVSNLKLFRSSNRYYLPIEDGNIIQLIAKANTLFIQQKDNLSVAMIKDVLDSEGSLVYTGSGDIFDRPPSHIRNNIGESIRCTHPLHCQDTMIGICIIDNFNKAIYTVNGDQVDAISHIECDSFFKSNLNTGYDNPFKGLGWQIASNNIKNTIYITSLNPLNRWTMSFNPIIKGWYSYHDYFDMYMINAGEAFYSINKGYLYKHAKGNKGLYYRNDSNVRTRNRSFIDIVCSDNRAVNKIFESIIFETNYFDVNLGSKRYDKSVDKLMVYNGSQCSVIKDISSYHGDDSNNWFEIAKRNVGENWIVNDFRDNVININNPFLTKDKEVINSNLSLDKDWFDNSLITSGSCVIRLVMNNDNDDIVQIVAISVYARKSNV